MNFFSSLWSFEVLMQSLMKSIFICIFCVHWIFGDIQEKLFKVVGLPMVENCLAGYNSCMFAYGQVNQSPHPPTSKPNLHRAQMEIVLELSTFGCWSTVMAFVGFSTLQLFFCKLRVVLLKWVCCRQEVEKRIQCLVTLRMFSINQAMIVEWLPVFLSTYLPESLR